MGEGEFEHAHYDFIQLIAFQTGIFRRNKNFCGQVNIVWTFLFKCRTE